MKNKDTWLFAHRYVGKIWRSCGWILLVLTVIIMPFTIGRSEDSIGYIGTIICLVQMLPLIGAMIPTEIALHKTFDKEGNRK